MVSRLIRTFLFILTAVVLLSGCGREDGAANRGGEGFTIVTSFYPMYISTINVAKDIPGVEVINMTKPQTGCLHDYQLSPEDLKTLEKADAFVINGAGMEAFMDKVISQQRDLKIVEAGKGIEVIRDANGEENPHVWVSISDAILQVENISGQLASIDTANALKYRSNADAYIKKLDGLREKMHRSLDGIKNKNIITFHEAFPYFAKEFGLNIAAVIEREPGTSPSPRELEDTIDIVKDSGIKALFAEPQYPAKTADMIAAETGARVYDLDPAVTGEAKPEAYDDYLNIMEQNLKSLEEALK